MKKDLKQLIIEANKYSNADDFSNAIENVMAKKNRFGGLSNTGRIQKLNKAEQILSDAHLKGGLGLHEIIPFYIKLLKNK